MLETLRDALVSVASVDPQDVTSETALKTDLGLDSLDLFQLLMELEDAFHIQVDPDSLASFSTVGDIIRYLEENGIYA